MLSAPLLNRTSSALILPGSVTAPGMFAIAFSLSVGLSGLRYPALDLPQPTTGRSPNHVPVCSDRGTPRRLAVERHQRGALPALHRPRAGPSANRSACSRGRPGTTSVLRSTPRARRLSRHLRRRDAGLVVRNQPARSTASSTAAPIAAARLHQRAGTPAILLHVSRLELRPRRPADRRRVRARHQAAGRHAARVPHGRAHLQACTWPNSAAWCSAASAITRQTSKPILAPT